MSDKLSETILLKPGVINAAVKHEWADKARLLEQQVEEWELEAKRLYGVGQDIEEMRVALEAKLEAIEEAVGYAMDVLTNSGLDDVVDYIEETWPESVAAAQKEQSNETA